MFVKLIALLEGKSFPEEYCIDFLGIDFFRENIFITQLVWYSNKVLFIILLFISLAFLEWGVLFFM